MHEIARREASHPRRIVRPALGTARSPRVPPLAPSQSSAADPGPPYLSKSEHLELPRPHRIKAFNLRADPSLRAAPCSPAPPP